MKVSYFTDPHLREVLSHPGNRRPLAIHIEHQSQSWLDGSVTHHGRLCAELLGGPLMGPGRDWDSGLLDKLFTLKETFMEAAAHPATRLLTISTSYYRTGGQVAPDLSEKPAPLILKAVGNNGTDWKKRRAGDCLTMLHVQPAFIRVGEAVSRGNIHPHSQSSGPAFVCSHPFHLDPGYGFIFHPTKREIDDFLDHARASGYASDPMPEAWSAGKMKHGKPGTSFSTPHAGAMIMRHSAGMEGLTSFDILPAALLAAQDSKPETGRLVRNGAGLVFDQAQGGFGFLDENALSLRLKQVQDFSSACGGHSIPVTKAAQGTTGIETPCHEGPVVNVALLLRFRTDHGDKRAENDVPLFVELKSPAGTKMRLPLLIDRSKGDKYDGSIQAGFQTVAFLGEDISRGVWQISCPMRIWGSYKIDQAEIVTHCLPPESPGAAVLRHYCSP